MNMGPSAVLQPLTRHKCTTLAFGTLKKLVTRPPSNKRRGFHVRKTYRRKHIGDSNPTRNSRGEIELPSGDTAVKIRSAPRRFFNPWYDLAGCCNDSILSDKVDSVTRTFGVVAALMCSLSAALLAVNLSSPDDIEDSTHRQKSANATVDAEEICFMEHFHVSGTSLLVSRGVPPAKLHDIYMACCAGSFYGGVCATGLSAVLNAWLAATPPGGARYFVRRHSVFICTIPALLGISTGLAGAALFIGLDRSKGTPISYIGLGGTILGGALIGSAAFGGWMSTYRLLTPLVKKL